ncbi:MAG: SprB repeat-containing protein, partial [Flavobacteriales bacterium]|nr:SprB repeat-containing protein [Flavobacteriales bacterium]
MKSPICVLRILSCSIFIFGLSLTSFAQPANDTCISATDVTADLNSGSCSSYNTAGATNQIRSTCDTNYCGGGSPNNLNNNVWFTFIAPSTGELTVTINGYSWNTPNYDPIVALYNSCDSTTQISCSPVGGDGSDQDGIKTVAFAGLVSGNMYYMSVDPPCSVTGIFCMKLDYLSHCLNSIQDYDEISIDCGGVQCAECSPGIPTFQSAIGGPTSEFGYSVTQTSDGGYIVGGYTNSYGQGSNDLYLVKTNSLGDTAWTKTYGGTSIDDGYTVQQTTDGGYLMVGSTQMGPGGQSIYVVKVNSVGDSIWERAYGGASSDDARGAVETIDGGYVIAGSTYNQGAGTSDAYLFKINGLGDTLWSRSYGGTSSEYFQDVKQTIDGGFIVTGTTQSFGAGGIDVYLIKTDSLGDTLWTRTFGSSSSDYGESVIEVSTGGYLIGGYSQLGPGAYAAYMVRTDASGNTLWTRAYGGTASEKAYAVIENSFGEFIMVGSTTSFGFGVKDLYFLKVNSSGALMVAKTFGGALDDEANGIGLCSDGGYIICGNTKNFSGSDQKIYLIKTDADGVALGCLQSGTSTSEEAPATITGSTNTIVTTVDTGMSYSVVNSNAASTPSGVYGPGIGIALSGTTVTCFNGSDAQATADVTCAAQPFSYLWSDGQTTATATGLAAGTYEVLVTDSFGTVDSNTISIFQAPVISTTLLGAYQICTGSDGHVDSWIAGGTGAYSFAWSNGDTTQSIFGLQANMYNVTVTDAVGCSVTDSVEVTLHIDTLDFTFISTPVNCDAVCDGSLDANVTGGTLPYAYSWNDPGGTTTDLAGNICAGVFVVTVTDTYGCIGIDSATVPVIPMPVQSICMITVDTTSSKNLIVWEKPISAGIDYYNIYREVSTNNYVLVGSVPYGNLSEFVDTTYGVSPATTSYRYKISLVDTCGVENPLSSPHKTIHMIISIDIFSKPVLQWNDYEGVTVVNYRILRDSTGTNSWQVLDSVPFGVNSWTDQNPPNDSTLTYVVEVVLPSTCTSTKTKDYNTTRSNFLFNGSVLTATAGATDASPGICNGTVSVAANYGLLPYTYGWNTVPPDSTSFVDSMCQGTYTVTVIDANGDTAIATVTVDQPNSMSAGVSSTNPTLGNCDGSLTVTASAGLPPYTYLWSTTPVQTTASISSLCQGTYDVTVYDSGGDSISLSVTITETALPMSGAGSTTAATIGNCDGTASVSTSGGVPPYTYLWNTTPAQTTIMADSLCQGNYDVTVYDGAGDSVIVSVTIIEIAAPMSGSTSTSSTTQGNCDGIASVAVTGGTPTYTYL